MNLDGGIKMAETTKPKKREKPNKPEKITIQTVTPTKQQELADKGEKEVYEYLHIVREKTAEQLRTNIDVFPQVIFYGKSEYGNCSGENGDKISKIEIIADLPTFNNNGRLRIEAITPDGNKRYYNIGEGYTRPQKLIRDFDKLKEMVKRGYERADKIVKFRKIHSLRYDPDKNSEQKPSPDESNNGFLSELEKL